MADNEIDTELARIEMSEMIGLLASRAPSDLARLRAEFPEFSEVLKPGKRLGTAPVELQPGEIRAMIKISRLALDQALALAESSQKAAHSRLSRGRQVEFFSHFVTLATTSGTTLLLLFNQSQNTVYLAAGSFLASLLTMVTTFYRTGIGGGKDSLVTVHARLAGSIPEVIFLRGRLEANEAGPALDARSRRGVGQLVSRAEELCKEVRGWASQLA